MKALSIRPHLAGRGSRGLISASKHQRQRIPPLQAITVPGPSGQGKEEEEEFELVPDTSLLLYLDCADAKQWEKWADTGLFYGEGAQAGWRLLQASRTQLTKWLVVE